ncbi:unnamed protein product [Larinioides sclopetarius]|uniref:Uncharacterized protein n=1 Tax=Larinioides sclopetarius TaxID=280406 RepID=A0AAV2AHG1_9ARAC
MNSWLILVLVFLAMASMVLAGDTEAMCLRIHPSTMNMAKTMMNTALTMYQKYRA